MLVLEVEGNVQARSLSVDAAVARLGRVACASELAGVVVVDVDLQLA
jgi:hypothetical protein